MTREEMVSAPITLDGEPARIQSANTPFALIYLASGKGGVVEFSWAAVEHVITNRKGAFIS